VPPYAAQGQPPAGPPWNQPLPQTRRRRRLGCLFALLFLGVVAAAIIIAAFHYIPIIDDVREVRVTADRLSTRLDSLGIEDLDRATVEGLRSDLNELDGRLAPMVDVLADDPLVGIARQVPALAVQVQAAESLSQAGTSLVEAGQIGIDLADSVVSLREANASDSEFALLPGLVELMATSAPDVDRMADLLTDVEGELALIPDEAVPQIRDARDLMADRLADYTPMLQSYRDADDVLPELLGWGGEKRYLVLAQNPAELRPTGGYTGTVGTLVFRDGAIVEQRFTDTYELSTQEGLPFIDPPTELADYLLGDDQSWRLADANWSPDYPASAQRAVEFYQGEAGEGDIDGVIAITTYGLDRLLEVVGAVDAPEYDVTVRPGEVTMTILGATRGTVASIDGRKEVLDVLAREVMGRLLSLPPERWSEMVSALEDIGEQRMGLLWLADQDAQRLVEQAGWTGAVRQDAGDYLYVVESNVAPTSKYNLVVDRADTLVVRVDEDGDAVNKLRLDWDNRAGEVGEPYDSLREFSINQLGWYGAYVRVLTPADSELASAKGQDSGPIQGAELKEAEAGRSVFGNYLFMPPGASMMRYRWTVPGAAVQSEDGWLYELTVQKQPGARSLPLSIRVDLPDGATVSEASDGAIVEGQQVRYEADLSKDVELMIRYDLSAGAEDAGG
jgi:hypothetical protein